jgi:hypothetical protein
MGASIPWQQFAKPPPAEVTTENAFKTGTARGIRRANRVANAERERKYGYGNTGGDIR